MSAEQLSSTIMHSHASRLWLRAVALAAITSAASSVFGQAALSVAATDKPAEWTITSGGQKLLVYFSLNQALELGVREGASIPFALRGERVRVFAQPAGSLK